MLYSDDLKFGCWNRGKVKKLIKRAKQKGSNTGFFRFSYTVSKNINNNQFSLTISSNELYTAPINYLADIITMRVEEAISPNIFYAGNLVCAVDGGNYMVGLDFEDKLPLYVDNLVERFEKEPGPIMMVLFITRPDPSNNYAHMQSKCVQTSSPGLSQKEWAKEIILGIQEEYKEKGETLLSI